MSFDIQGRIKGDKEVVRALNKAPKMFFFTLREWLKNERANMVGGKDAKGKTRKGFRQILANKKLKKRSGTWSTKVAHLFRGVIPFAKNINDLRLMMGVLGRSKHQLQKALELLATGGSITSSSQMPVPIYKNLAKIGFTGAMSMGSVRTGMKSKAIWIIARSRGLVGIKKGGKVYYFDQSQRNEKGKYPRSALLFMGLFGVRVRRQLSGRYDFYARWDRILPSALNRGQGAVDKATKRVERVK